MGTAHFQSFTTVFLDSWLWKTKQPRKRLQNFHQFCVLSTERIEMHQPQPLVWPSDLLYVMLAGCDWWISIRSVDNMCDWRKFQKRFRGCFVYESRESRKTVVNSQKKLHQCSEKHQLHFNLHLPTPPLSLFTHLLPFPPSPPPFPLHPSSSAPQC